MWNPFKKQQTKEHQIEVLETQTIAITFDEYGQPEQDVSNLAHYRDDSDGNPVFYWKQKSDANRAQTWYAVEE